MAKEQVTIDVEKASYDVGQAVVQLISSIKTTLAAGGGLGVEIPAIISQNLSVLMQVISEAPQIPAESKDDLHAFIKAWACSGVDIAGLFLK